MRSEIVPLNAIIIQSNIHKPTGWSNESSLFGQYIRSTALASTEPGGSQGALQHTHDSDGGHVHTTTSTHLHSATTSGEDHPPSSVTSEPGGGPPNHTSDNHTHVWTSDSNASLSDTVTNTGAHTHDAQINDPAHKTQFLLKHTETSINLRRKSLGQDSIFMWGQVTANLPGAYAPDTNFDDVHIKGVANAGSTPNESAGNNTHSHDTSPNHTHGITMPTHSHTYSGVGGTATPIRNAEAGGTLVSEYLHTHNVNTIALDTNAGTIGPLTSPNQSATHTHDTVNIEPPHKLITFVKNTTIKLRQGGIIPGGIVMWLDATADIPSRFQVSDGTNGTSNYLDKYPKGIEPAGAPGATAGSINHTHAATSSHTHAATSGFGHTHEPSGVSSTENEQISVGTAQQSQGTNPAHTHNPVDASTSEGPSPTLDSADTHTHGSKGNRPPTIVVSFIERLTP